jgi:hypothetical protein
VIGDLTTDEIELLNAYSKLGTSGQRELSEYLRYLLCKQYKRDVMVAVFHNQLMHSLLHSLLHLVERDDFEVKQVDKRVQQLRDLYFGLFEDVHYQYSEIITDLDSNELVKDFGTCSFNHIQRAIDLEDRSLIRMEIVEFYEGYLRLSKRDDCRKIVAV